MLFSWRTSKAQFSHSPLQESIHLPWECSWITSMLVCFGQKTFLLADSIFQVFSSKSINAFVERDKTKFARSFFPAFLCSSAIAKSSVSLLILFSTINFDASKLDNLLEIFYFSWFGFVHFVIHCFVYYLQFFFLFWVFTIGIYTMSCLKATYFL